MSIVPIYFKFILINIFIIYFPHVSVKNYSLKSDLEITSAGSSHVLTEKIECNKTWVPLLFWIIQNQVLNHIIVVLNILINFF